MNHISVVVPVYGTEKYLKRCVDSVLDQTYTNFDLILVDDGSPDNCPEICDNYAREDSRITVIHQENQGLSGARNAGLELIEKRGESDWITFVDSDDWIHPEYLQILLAANLDNGTMISCTYHVPVKKGFVRGTHSIEGSVIKNPEDFYFGPNGRIYSYAWGKLFSAELVKGRRFPVGRLWEDMSYVYKPIFSCEKISVTTEPVYYYFINPEGIVYSKWEPYKMDEFRSYDEIIPFFKKYQGGALYHRVLKSMCMACFAHISKLPEEYRKEYERSLLKKARPALIKTARNDRSFYEKHRAWYKMAFPRAYKLAGKIIRIKKTLI